MAILTGLAFGMTYGIAGLPVGILGGIGLLSGGTLGDRGFARGGVPTLPRLAAITAFVSTATGMLFLMVSSTTLVIVGLILFELIGRTYTAPGYSAVVGSLQPRKRALCVSILQIAINLMGYGCGPLLAGIVSDRVGGTGGTRWGLMALMLLGFWAALRETGEQA